MNKFITIQDTLFRAKTIDRLTQTMDAIGVQVKDGSVHYFYYKDTIEARTEFARIERELSHAALKIEDQV